MDAVHAESKCTSRSAYASGELGPRKGSQRLWDVRPPHPQGLHVSIHRKTCMSDNSIVRQSVVSNATNDVFLTPRRSRHYFSKRCSLVYISLTLSAKFEKRVLMVARNTWRWWFDPCCITCIRRSNQEASTARSPLPGSVWEPYSHRTR